ncbi:hypothetical protein JXM67_05445 [candidate division WOR-3 bacterium]|nr:hypothetical protein [candidate division WOR-3 bacterium]
MKKTFTLMILGISLIAAPGTITWIRVEEGDSVIGTRNIVSINVDLNIQGTHIWDYSSENVTWDEIEEYSWVKKASEGLFGYYFQRSELVSQTFSAVDTVESYVRIKPDGLISYGFTTLREGKSSPSPIQGADSAQVLIFPVSIGDSWVSSYTMSAGQATLEVNDFNNVVDTGTLITDLDTFHCVVNRLHKLIVVKVFGITVQQISLYRYDWYADSLTSVLTIQSSEDETNPNFIIADKVSRVKGISFYVPDTIDTTDAVTEALMFLDGKLEAAFIPQGLELTLDADVTGDAELGLYDASGRFLAGRVWNGLQSGRNELIWNVNVCKGVYFIHLLGQNIRKRVKVIELR